MPDQISRPTSQPLGPARIIRQQMKISGQPANVSSIKMGPPGDAFPVSDWPITPNPLPTIWTLRVLSLDSSLLSADPTWVWQMTVWDRTRGEALQNWQSIGYLGGRIIAPSDLVHQLVIPEGYYYADTNPRITWIPPDNTIRVFTNQLLLLSSGKWNPSSAVFTPQQFQGGDYLDCVCIWDEYAPPEVEQAVGAASS